MLRGHLEFDGSRDFLPATLAALSSTDAASIVFRYRYDSKPGDVDLSVLALFNPLSLVGFPTGSSSVTASATLDVLSDGRVVKQYHARTDASRLRTIYSGDPGTVLRRNALTATARSIDAQIVADRAALDALCTDRSQSSTRNKRGEE